MEPPSPDHRRRNLRIHGVALGLVALAWVALALALGRGPPERAIDLSGLVAIFWGLVALGYVALTSTAMAALYRRRGAALVIHGIGFGLVAGLTSIGAWIEREGEVVHPAEIARAAGEGAALRVRGCLSVDALRLAEPAADPLDPSDTSDTNETSESRLTIDLVLTNACAGALVITDVDLIGFPPSGGNRILGAPGRITETIPPAGARTFTLRAELPGRDDGELRRWGWRSNVTLADPEAALLCFATADAPATAGCRPIEPARIGGRR